MREQKFIIILSAILLIIGIVILIETYNVISAGNKEKILGAITLSKNLLNLYVYPYHLLLDETLFWEVEVFFEKFKDYRMLPAQYTDPEGYYTASTKILPTIYSIYDVFTEVKTFPELKPAIEKLIEKDGGDLLFLDPTENVLKCIVLQKTEKGNYVFVKFVYIYPRAKELVQKLFDLYNSSFVDLKIVDEDLGVIVCSADKDSFLKDISKLLETLNQRFITAKLINTRLNTLEDFVDISKKKKPEDIWDKGVMLLSDIDTVKSYTGKRYKIVSTVDLAKLISVKSYRQGLIIATLTFGIYLLLVLVSFLLLLLTIRSQQEKLRGISSYIERIREYREFDKVFSEEIDRLLGQSKDYIFRTYRDFMYSIKLLITEIRGLIEEIEVSAEEFYKNRDKFDEEVKEFVSGYKKIGENIESLSSMVSEISAAMEEMMKSVENVNNNIQKQFELTEEMTSGIEELSASIGNISKRIANLDAIINEITGKAEEGNSKSLKSIESVRSIEESSYRITDILELINNIATRTEILAMNASIEAAHAGKYGKGFSVVAEEMYVLAETSKKAIKDIERFVQDILEKVKSATEMANETGNAFSSIVEGLKEISKISGEINAGMKEQVAGSRNLLQAVSNLTSFADNVRLASMEQKSGIEEIGKAIISINDYVAKISDMQESFSEKLVMFESLIEEINNYFNKFMEKVSQIRSMFEGRKWVEVESPEKRIKSIALVE